MATTTRTRTGEETTVVLPDHIRAALAQVIDAATEQAARLEDEADEVEGWGNDSDAQSLRSQSKAIDNAAELLSSLSER